MIALSSEAKTTPAPLGMTYSGLMPSGSRTRVRLPVRASWMAKANMPRNRRSDAVPQARHASSTTSVSERVAKRTPNPSSSLRIWRKL